MIDGQTLKPFKFWCQKVLPLVYDDSLSYYEILCKVVDYLNKVIADDNKIVDNIAELDAALKAVQDIINNFDTEYAEKIIGEYLATMIFVEIPNGYFVYYIPESWHDIQFNTTDYDVDIEGYDYGHLVLSY